MSYWDIRSSFRISLSTGQPYMQSVSQRELIKSQPTNPTAANCFFQSPPRRRQHQPSQSTPQRGQRTTAKTNRTTKSVNALHNFLRPQSPTRLNATFSQTPQANWLFIEFPTNCFLYRLIIVDRIIPQIKRFYIL